MHSLRLLLLLPLIVGTAVIAQQDLPERQQILALVAAGKDVEALAGAKDWTQRHPDLPEALLLYAQLQQNADDIAGALDSLDGAYFLSRDVNIIVRKGQVYLDTGQLDQAQRQFRLALRQHETCVSAHLGLALIMLEKRDFAEAGSAARAALALDPQSTEAMVTLARLNVQTGKPSEAEKLLQRALAQKPDDPAAHLWLGRVYLNLGRHEQARAAWRRYATLQPADNAAWLLAHNLYLAGSKPFACSGYYPSFARDGKQLAFRGRGDAGAIYISKIEEPDKGERIYESTATIYTIDWSPDSKYLLCRDYVQETVDNKPQYKYRLFVLEAKPEGKTTTLYEGRYVGQPGWGPDGKSIVFDGYIQGKGRGILSVPTTGGEAAMAIIPATGESFMGCLWLRDGKHAVLQRWSQAEKEYQLVLSDTTDRKQDRILTRAQQSLYALSLSPDGKYLLYYRRLGQPPMWSLMAVALDSPGVAHPLGVRTQQMLPPAMTPDMKHVLLYQGPELMMFDLDGVGGS